LELPNVLGTVTDGASSMIGYKNGMVSLLYTHMHNLHLKNELIQYNYIIHHQNLTGRALGFKQIVIDAVSAVKLDQLG
jgi:hypothetical protein